MALIGRHGLGSLGDSVEPALYNPVYDAVGNYLGQSTSESFTPAGSVPPMYAVSSSGQHYNLPGYGWQAYYLLIDGGGAYHYFDSNNNPISGIPFNTNPNVLPPGTYDFYFTDGSYAGHVTQSKPDFFGSDLFAGLVIAAVGGFVAASAIAAAAPAASTGALTAAQESTLTFSSATGADAAAMVPAAVTAPGAGAIEVAAQTAGSAGAAATLPAVAAPASVADSIGAELIPGAGAVNTAGTFGVSTIAAGGAALPTIGQVQSALSTAKTAAGIAAALTGAGAAGSHSGAPLAPGGVSPLLYNPGYSAYTSPLPGGAAPLMLAGLVLLALTLRR